jgi:predicted DNA-binding protein (MmcQ/YjbR family)
LKSSLPRKALARREYLLRHLRGLCLCLPETAETVKWGNPAFVAGKKMFAVLDRYDNRWCIAFRVNLDAQAQLVKRPDIVPAPYSAKQRWVCLDGEGKFDWDQVQTWLLDSYRLVALKRMMNALEDISPSGGTRS